MFDLQQTAIAKLKAYTSKFTIVVSVVALSIFVWSNFGIATNNITANAETINDFPFVMSTAGIQDQVEGAVDKSVGTAKRAIGDMRDDPAQEMEGAIQQTKGGAKLNLGDAKNKLDSAEDTVENKTESIIDSVKDFFD
jgi:uncharacterized protein YjbJ (UPF0337 family)